MLNHTIYLIPGFMSPTWMMFPLQRYLGSTFDDFNRWDYPRVFGDLDATIETLSKKLDRHQDGTVAIVAHSFGDLIVRSAISRMQTRTVTSLVSICPVVTSVHAAVLAQRITGNRIPEFGVMADTGMSSVDIPPEFGVERSFIWAAGEMLVRQHSSAPVGARQRTILATHNSVLFQPNAWSAIRDELLAHA